MKECPKCGVEHNKLGLYCSRKCANSRIWTDEDKLKKSISIKNSGKSYFKNLKGKPGRKQTKEERDKKSRTLKENYTNNPNILLKIQNTRNSWSKEYREEVRRKMSLNMKPGSGGRSKGSTP